MSTTTRSARPQVYKRLKTGFWKLSGMMNAHLEDTLLCELGVDQIQVDLEDETQRGGPYFLPMSQESIDSLDKRPEICITFDDGDDGDDEDLLNSPWDLSDAVHMAFQAQLYDDNCDGCWRACDQTLWQARWHKSSYQTLLLEYRIPCCDEDSTRQSSWRMEEHFAAKGFPHRSCVSRAGIPDVQGLTRHEMMIVTGMMIAAMREYGNGGVVIVPLVLVSIIGKYARVIQAHVSLEDQRLKVRYTQLYDFANCSQHQMDLFLRWTLSSPLTEPRLQYEAAEAACSPKGDTAPLLTVPKLGCHHSKSHDLGMPMEALKLAGEIHSCREMSESVTEVNNTHCEIGTCTYQSTSKSPSTTSQEALASTLNLDGLDYVTAAANSIAMFTRLNGSHHPFSKDPPNYVFNLAAAMSQHPDITKPRSRISRLMEEGRRHSQRAIAGEGNLKQAHASHCGFPSDSWAVIHRMEDVKYDYTKQHAKTTMISIEFPNALPL